MFVLEIEINLVFKFEVRNSMFDVSSLEFEFCIPIPFGVRSLKFLVRSSVFEV